MQFVVIMRDGSRFRVEAAYIEVVTSEQSSYTFLGPVPGYRSAILATVPVSLVAAIVPYNQLAGYVPATSSNGQVAASGADKTPAPGNGRRPQMSTVD